MKRFFITRYNSYFLDIALVTVRVLVGLTMLTHGTPKLARLSSDGIMHFGDPLNIGPGPSLVLAVFAEFFCSVFIILGLGTRLAVLPLMATMLVAAFIVHKADGFGKQELALLYLIIYFMLFIAGSGKYSIDRFITQRWTKSSAKDEAGAGRVM